MGPLVPTGMTQGRIFEEAEMRLRLGMAGAPEEAGPDVAGPVRCWWRLPVAWGVAAARSGVKGLAGRVRMAFAGV